MLAVIGLTHIEATVQALVEIFHAFSFQEIETLPMVAQIYSQLLMAENTQVKSRIFFKSRCTQMCTNVIGRWALPPSKHLFVSFDPEYADAEFLFLRRKIARHPSWFKDHSHLFNHQMPRNSFR